MKRKLRGDSGSIKKRQSISMEMKVAIIMKLDCGENCAYKLNRSTVGTIYKSKDRIMEHVKSAVPMASTIISKKRGKCMEEMEKLLVMWIEHQKQRRVSLSLMLIQEKARSLYKDVKAKAGGEAAGESFVASHGWFNRFKMRANLHNVGITGEAASADKKAAEEFPVYLKSILLVLDNAPGHPPHLDDFHLDVQREVQKSNLNGVWKYLTSQFVNDFTGFDQDVENQKILNNLVDLSKKLELDLEEEDFHELLESHGEELINEDLMELEEMQRQEDNENSEEEPPPVKKFNTKLLAEAFSKIEEALSIFESQDPNVERFTKVSTNMPSPAPDSPMPSTSRASSPFIISPSPQ
ncbi:tigger transposable element-derived protein 1-like [Palaemon carinicauda]|uniref:tigger transposable element-derived protein 1-like n=1 Tax=Palaemon carinicauda TaxID=392227 RepID=UPI0035B5C21A